MHNVRKLKHARQDQGLLHSSKYKWDESTLEQDRILGNVSHQKQEDCCS